MSLQKSLSNYLDIEFQNLDRFVIYITTSRLAVFFGTHQIKTLIGKLEDKNCEKQCMRRNSRCTI